MCSDTLQFSGRSCYTRETWHWGGWTFLGYVDVDIDFILVTQPSIFPLHCKVYMVKFTNTLRL